MVQPYVDMIPLGTRKFLTIRISEDMIGFIIEALETSKIEDKNSLNATITQFQEFHEGMKSV